MDNLTQRFNKLNIRRGKPTFRRKISPPVEIDIDRTLPNYIQEQEETDNWSIMRLKKQTVRNETLDSYDDEDEYDEVADLFYETSSGLVIDSIDRIQNPYLMFAYLLKRQQAVELYGENITERSLFHATKDCYVDGICKNNFNWRFFGRSKGFKYGQGVSFSPKASYADKFGEQTDTDNVMFLAKVFYNRICVGNRKMNLPPYGFNASKRPNGEVIVKYEDNEFYPEYVIYYSVEDD